jgi:hypothetical protein
METFTLESLLAFFSAAAILAVLVYADQLRRPLSLLHAVVILFAVSNLLRGCILLQGETIDLWDAWMRLAMTSLRNMGMVLMVAYAMSCVNLRAGKALTWFYGAAYCLLWTATLAGYGDSEASVTGGMRISEGLRGARHAFVLAGLGLLIVTMLTGLNSSEMLIRQRCRTTVWALFPVALLFSLLAMLRFLNIGLAADVVLLSLIPFAICTVVWVLVLEEAQLLAPLSIKVEVLWKIFMRQGKIDARSLSDSLEQAMVLSALRRSENNKAEAARLLGLSKSTFHRKASRYLPRPAAEVSPVSSELVAHEEEGSALATTHY